MKTDEFVEDLAKVFIKHGIAVEGELNTRDMSTDIPSSVYLQWNGYNTNNVMVSVKGKYEVKA